MKEVAVTLETITPLFLGGADSRGQAELRSPPFRGGMRYWFRAVLGGVIGDHNLEGLHQLESLIFGSTNNGSPITVRVKPKSQLRFSTEYILPHNRRGRRSAIDAGQEFEVSISQTRPSGDEMLDALIWLNACMAFNLMILFGGVGLRSRRGYGSLRIANSELNLIPRTPLRLKNWDRHIQLITRSAISNAKKLAEYKKIPTVALPEPPTLFPCAAKGALVRLFPARLRSPRDAVVRSIEHMPRDNAFGGINPRQASPLWTRVISADNSYHLLFLVLPSKLKRRTDYDAVHQLLDRHFSAPDIEIEGWNHE